MRSHDFLGTRIVYCFFSFCCNIHRVNLGHGSHFFMEKEGKGITTRQKQLADPLGGSLIIPVVGHLEGVPQPQVLGTYDHHGS